MVLLVLPRHRSRQREVFAAASTKLAWDHAADAEEMALRAVAASRQRADELTKRSLHLCGAWDSEHDVCVHRLSSSAYHITKRSSFRND